MQGIDHRITAMRVVVVTGWKNDDHIAISRFAVEIAFDGGRVDPDALDGDGFCARHDGRNLSLYLRGHGQRDGRREKQRHDAGQFDCHSMAAAPADRFSTVTDLARLRGWQALQPLADGDVISEQGDPVSRRRFFGIRTRCSHLEKSGR